MESPVIIKLDHVSKTYRLYKNDRRRLLGLFLKNQHYKEFKAINDISFEIRKGESVGLVGRNGAGKSTLLKMITGVCFPDKGEVYVGGLVAALLELTAGFDLEMTGRENIYLRGYVLGLTKSQIADIEEDIVDFSELDDFMDQPVRTYSSGMKARLGFSINVSIHPEILVIDEALSVGDAAFSEKCREKISEKIAEGVTVLFVSHTKERIKEFCTRAILMDKGRILADGTTQEICDKYDALLKKSKKKK